MLHTITPAAMREAERETMRATDVTSLALMERAAAHVASVALRWLTAEAPVALVLCGCGNNGGDGLAAARILLERLPSLTVIVWRLLGDPSAETREQLRLLEPYAARVLTEAPRDALPACRCVIDAMYGTGLSRPLAGDALTAALAVNAADVPVLAVDVPSGLDGLTGQALGACVRATVTVSFHRLKQGLLLADGPDFAGELIAADIGLPDADDGSPCVLAVGDMLLPPRKRNTHKGSYGRVLILAGSFGMAGAAAICAMAALRAGAGLVTVACAEAVVPSVQALCPCATCLPLPDVAEQAFAALLPSLESADAIVAGCGLGRASDALLERLLPWLCAHPTPAVLDADALNWLATQETPPLPTHIMLTPHPGEAARLLRNQPLSPDPLANARKLREALGGTIVLKGAATVIVGADGEAISPFGSAAMAKGGSGDALAGVIGALLAGREAYDLHGVRLLQSACALHGLAGALAAERCGERGMLAIDLCEALGLVPGTLAQGATTLALDTRVQPEAALGRRVRVTVDRPLGSAHPEHREIVYGLNYGYVADVLAADNEWLDAYIWGASEPVEVFEGEVVAVIHRLDDAEDKWVVAPIGTRVAADDVRRRTDFVERFYRSEIYVL